MAYTIPTQNWRNINTTGKATSLTPKAVSPIGNVSTSAYEWEEPWTRPSWMPSGASQWQYWNEVDVDPSWVNQTWLRSPEWGGHVIYNPYFGWQDYPTVANLYKEAGGPVSWKDFQNWGLTPQMGQNWATYFPDRTVGTGGSTSGNITGGEDLLPSIYYPSDKYDAISDIYRPTDEYLQQFGWTGNVDINPYEQSALDFINQLYGTQAPLETLAPAQQFYNELLGGQYGPESEKYLQDVYGATKTQAMDLLGEMQKDLAEQFSQQRGYFSGKHGIAQSNLARGFGQDLNTLLANMKQEAFQGNLANMLSGATGLESLGGTQMNIANSILGNLLTGGEMITSREMLNRSEWQNALQRAYEDWNRARQENLMPFSAGLSLLGFNPYQPVSEYSSSPWGDLMGAGSTLGAAALFGK